MTFLEAARRVLADAGTALHFEEITRRAQALGYLVSSGTTPEATMASRLYTQSKHENAEFTREGMGYFRLAGRSEQGIDTLIESVNAATRKDLKQRLLAMDPKKFQSLVYDLLVEMGFDEATLRRFSNDGGIDVTGVYRGAGITQVNAAVQVKRWKSNVQAPEVQKVRGALEVGQQGIIVTTSAFSSGARLEANKPTKAPVSLIDGETLVDLLIKHKIGVIDKVHRVLQIDEELWKELGEDSLAATKPTEKEVQPSVPTRQPQTESHLQRRGQKPAGIKILEVVYPVQSWREGLLKAAEVLYQADPDSFESRVFGLGGKKRVYVGRSPDKMHTPALVSDLGFYVETNQSATTVRSLVTTICEAAGYSKDVVAWILLE